MNFKFVIIFLKEFNYLFYSHYFTILSLMGMYSENVLKAALIYHIHFFSFLNVPTAHID